MKYLPTLQTVRLILRPFELADASEVQKLAGAREIASVTLNIPHPYEDGMAEEWISTHQETFEQGKSVNFAIIEKETTRLCGAIGLGINSQNSNAELGYWIGVPYWRQGYCTEAALAVVAYGFENLNLHRIHSSHFIRNPASGRVMQKVGMIREGCLRQDVQKWGKFEDLVIYGILATEWHERKNKQRDEKNI
ncbi:MAG: GNAT family N-acetyltransferase [Pleurocapsa sp. MO_192.B19]|nr:GNAT family N-acetyltransferase [Pleurocapsa sp. MO_192.B19]